MKTEQKKQCKYVQCDLLRGKEKDIAWLPQRFGVVGKYLKINKIGNGWLVTKVGDKVVEREELEIIKDQCDTTRTVSDI